MIMFPALGCHGRLGNQLFQIATTVALALDNDDQYGFPRWSYEGRFPIQDCFHGDLSQGPAYEHPHFHYSKIPYQRNLRIHGYFQSDRFFIGHEDTVRRLLTPICLKRKKGRTASLHVRRGDYLDIQEYHPIVPLDYYHRATDFLKARGFSKFEVFSDDPGWCRRNINGPEFTIFPGDNEVDELAEMAACEAHIIANSSFSWWGAWLDPAPEKYVISPSTWFGQKLSHYDTKDLIPRGWLKF